MDYYHVAKTKEGGFIGQFPLEEIIVRFRAGDLLSTYVVTKAVDSYNQLIKSGTTPWITVADLVANLPVQLTSVATYSTDRGELRDSIYGAAASQFKGVAGWLRFFIFGQLYIGPTLFGIQMILIWVVVSRVADQYPGVAFGALIETGVGLAFIVWSIRVGIGLQEIKPQAVPNAKSFLLSVLLWKIFSPFILGPLSGLPAKVLVAPYLRDAFVTLIGFAIWYPYFNVSKRVKATYLDAGKKDPGSSPPTKLAEEQRSGERHGADRGETKKCPNCAEEIKFEATVCRYCGHQFEEAEVTKQIADRHEKRREAEEQMRIRAALGEKQARLKKASTSRDIRDIIGVLLMLLGGAPCLLFFFFLLLPPYSIEHVIGTLLVTLLLFIVVVFPGWLVWKTADPYQRDVDRLNEEIGELTRAINEMANKESIA